MTFKCAICDFNQSVHLNEYVRCVRCNHEVLVSYTRQTYIINEALTSAIVNRNSLLDRYKNSFVISKKNSKNLNLLDIGSASGKFIYDNEDNYKNAIGLEVTLQCLEFSRSILNIKVIEDISQLKLHIDIATAFHTFEHIPMVSLKKILSKLKSTNTNELEIIVSVPNARSIQYRLLGKNFAFYDVPNHIQQFSSSSLDLLMLNHGFNKIETYNGWIYNLFGWLQGLGNIGSLKKNYLYYRLKRGHSSGNTFLDFLALIRVIFWAPVALLFWAIEMLIINEKGVITICYQK